MIEIAFSVLFVLALVLASQKVTLRARPRGRFAPSVSWGSLPSFPSPRLRRRVESLARAVGVL